MPTDLSLRFVRVTYDDRRKFPWVVMWGEDHEWANYRTHLAAQDEASRLRDICDVFHEWASKERA
jgi:hypothetical protein